MNAHELLSEVADRAAASPGAIAVDARTLDSAEAAWSALLETGAEAGWIMSTDALLPWSKLTEAQRTYHPLAAELVRGETSWWLRLERGRWVFRTLTQVSGGPMDLLLEEVQFLRRPFGRRARYAVHWTLDEGGLLCPRAHRLVALEG